MKLHYKTKPWPHQVPVLRRMVRQRGGGIQVRMRWGKSWIGVNWAAALYHLEGVRRVLVITVSSGIGVWFREVEKHCPVPWRVLSHHGELVAQSDDEVQDKDRLTFLVVNFPNLYTRSYWDERQWIPVPNKVLTKFNAQAAICDESHHIGDPTAVTSKHARAMVKDKVRFRLFMTGTMFHRKPPFVFGQVQWYDDGRTFGTAWKHFKDRVLIMGGFGNYEIKGYRNLEWMMDKTRGFTYISDEDPKVPMVFNEIAFNLTGKHLDAYATMQDDKVLHVRNETVTAELILTEHLRLLQIAGGFTRLPSGKYAKVGNCKLEICRNRLEEYLLQDITKAVIGCRFLPELVAIAKMAKQLGFIPIVFHGGVPVGYERDKRVAKFQEMDKPALFISQIATGKESIDLSAASTMMLYSLTESYVQYDQFTSRIEKYNEKRTLMYDLLLANGTQDWVAWKAMQLKIDVATLLIQNPQLAEQLFATQQSAA